MSSPQIGITGAGGMIGRYLTENWEDVGLNLYSSQNLGLKNSVFRRHPDPNQDELASFVKSSGIIIHLGHDANPIESNQCFPQSFGVNISFTQRLISELSSQQAGKCPLLIYLSSGGTVYGESPPIEGGFTEYHATLPLSPYGLEKLTCEHLLRLGASRGYYKLVVLRASNIYGAPLEKNRSQGIIGVWLARIKSGLPLKLTMNPQTIRDYLHLQDLSSALRQVINTNLPESFYCFNVSSGQGHSISDLLEIIGTITQSEVKLQSTLSSYSTNAPTWNVLNHDKITANTGWRPTISIENGIASMWDIL